MTIYLAVGCEPAGGEIDPDELIQLALTPLAEIGRLVAPGPDRVAGAKTLIDLLLLLHQTA